MTALALLVPLALVAAPADPESCLDLLHGIGRTRDLGAARACLEASVPSPCPDASSPELARAELAAMYLDGQGGPAEPKKAWTLLGGCSENATVEALRSVFAHREPDGHFELCRRIRGTTGTIDACSHLLGRAAEARRAKAVARLRATLPPEARGKLDRAEKAWNTFARAAAELAADDARGGILAGTTLAATYRQSAWAELAEQRAGRLEGLEALEPASCDEGKLQSEDARLNVAYQDLRKDLDEQGRRLLRDAERAWILSREADGALGAAWRGAALETALKCVATRARAEALENVMYERNPGDAFNLGPQPGARQPFPLWRSVAMVSAK